MKVLLDTHVVLWWVNEYEKLSSKAKSALLADENKLYFSIASIWEIAIKSSLGKLSEFNGKVKDFLTYIEHMPVYMLPISLRHVETVETLPFVHRDPFDRILVATAKVDEMSILTADENIHKYDVPVIW